MNPEAVEWLEGLDFDQRLEHFTPVYPFNGTLMSVKPDHEPCLLCPEAVELIVVGGE